MREDATTPTTTDRLAEVLRRTTASGPCQADDTMARELVNPDGPAAADLLQSLSTDLDKAQAEIERLREALAAKPWPPTDAELCEMLAVIVGEWWSPSTAHTIRNARHLKVEDVKGMYAVRDVLAPYVARAALNPQPTGKECGHGC